MFSSKAQQNLVPNGSFEEYYQCPTGPGMVGDDQLERCKEWYKPSWATADYYNTCQTNTSSGVSIPNNWFGYQTPADGNAYIGLGIYIDGSSENCEYAQVKLLEPLEACKKYQVSFWVSLSDFSSRATNTIGIRLDNQPITKLPPFDFYGFELPSHVGTSEFIIDTTDWVLISGVYDANGDEQYLTVGRFLDTSYYSNANVPNITVNCDSCFDGQNTAYYYVDDISVIKLDDSDLEFQTPNILTANQDGLNDYWYPVNICFENWNCTIYNRWGNQVFNFNENSKGWSGVKPDGSDLSEGVYYYKVFNSNKIKTGFIQLIR